MPVSSFEVENPVRHSPSKESSGPSFGTLFLSAILLLLIGALAGFGIAALITTPAFTKGLVGGSNGADTGVPTVPAVPTTAAPTNAEPTDEHPAEAPHCESKAVPSKDFDKFVKRGAIFEMITEDEINSITSHILTSPKYSQYKLKPFGEASVRDNMIARMTIIPPSKAEAIPYMDGATDIAPKRYARLVMDIGDGKGLCTVFGKPADACLKEFKAGPLPLSPETFTLTQVNIASPMNADGTPQRTVLDLPFDARFAGNKEEDEIGKILEGLCSKTGVYPGDVASKLPSAHSFFMDQYGSSCAEDCTTADGCITWSNTGPFGSKHDMTMWLAFDIEALYANPIGTEITIRMQGSNPDNYFILQIVFNGQAFITPTIGDGPDKSKDDAVVQLLKAYQSGKYDATKPFKLIRTGAELPLLQRLKASKYGLGWAKLQHLVGDTDGASLLNSNILNPQGMQPGGDRYVIDGTHVEYLGWTFHISHDIQTGIKMYDVRYRGERIAYEIGMSEAMASYSGISDVVQAGTIYGDTTWGLGSCPSILVKGIDCPAYARLLDITFLEQDGTATTKKDAMCIFEQAMQGPVRRHYDRNSGGFNFYGGTPNHALVIRAFYPVYNYDYMIDHVFYHNGAFEIRGATSGYLQSTFYSEALAKEAKRFGVKIQDNVMGTEHDHFLNFKVDFDLIDEKNDVMIDRVKVLKCEGDALADYGAGCKPQDIYGKKFASQLFKDADDYQTKSIEHEYLTTEQGLSLTPDVPTMIHIVNKESKNAWGVERGYKMKINGVAQNVLANTKMHKAYSFSKHTVMATRYHEEELHVTTTFDQQDTTGTLFNGKPLIDMDQYLNGENIDNQDIVFWANVGVHHIPHSEDIPVTHMIGNAVQISFIPTNMYDMDQSMDLGNVVYMNVEEGKDSKINRYDLKDEPEDLCPLAPYLLGSNLVIESCEGYPAFGASE